MIPNLVQKFVASDPSALNDYIMYVLVNECISYNEALSTFNDLINFSMPSVEKDISGIEEYAESAHWDKSDKSSCVNTVSKTDHSISRLCHGDY